MALPGGQAYFFSSAGRSVNEVLDEDRQIGVMLRVAVGAKRDMLTSLQLGSGRHEG